ncbi:MAG: adenosylmethionine decarboxylase [Myxococcota bacterium]
MLNKPEPHHGERTTPPAFFEGPEKKVELAVHEGGRSLRSLGHGTWERVVRSAKAEVLSRRSNDHFDAYLLSESSLFVADSYLTMITCGRTQLVNAVELMFELLGKDELEYLFYERKNEHFPHAQPSSFFEDAARLRALVPGKAHRFGLEHEHAVRVFHWTDGFEPEPEDTTLEILMHSLPETLTQPGRITEALGLREILDAPLVDEFAFEPTGYSMNAISGRTYFTVHVTPEAVGSYVSVETNLPLNGNLAPLVERTVKVFRPESFDIVAFMPHSGELPSRVTGYELRKHVHEPLGGYHVTFQHHYRPSTGPQRAFSIPIE